MFQVVIQVIPIFLLDLLIVHQTPTAEEAVLLQTIIEVAHPTPMEEVAHHQTTIGTDLVLLIVLMEVGVLLIIEDLILVIEIKEVVLLPLLQIDIAQCPMM